MGDTMLRTNSTVFKAAYSGVNSSGEHTYGGTIAVSCLLAMKTEYVPGKDKETLKVTHVILAEEPFKHDEAIWLNVSDIGDLKKAIKVLLVESNKSLLDDTIYYRVKAG